MEFAWIILYECVLFITDCKTFANFFIMLIKKIDREKKSWKERKIAVFCVMICLVLQFKSHALFNIEYGRKYVTTSRGVGSILQKIKRICDNHTTMQLGQLSPCQCGRIWWIAKMSPSSESFVKTPFRRKFKTFCSGKFPTGSLPRLRSVLSGPSSAHPI